MDKIVKLDYRIVLITVLLCILHISIINYPYLSALIALLEAFFCIFLLLVKKISIFLFAITIFVITTFDLTYFTSGEFNVSFYTIVMLPLLKGYFFFFISLVPLLFIFKKKQSYTMFKVKLRNGKLKILYYFAVFSLFLGVFMGLFSILVNDNNIRSANFLKYYFNEFIGLGIFSLYTIYHIYFITTDEKYSFKLKKFLFSVLVGLIISSFFSIITGKRGHYGNQDIILMPLSFFYVNFVCIFLFYKDYNNKKIVLLLSLSSFMIQFIFSNALNGKSWLGVFYIILSLIIIQIRKKRIIILSIFLFFVILFSVLVKTYFENDNSNNLSMIKLEQALSFISVTDADWYDLLPNSPKITIEEILNIGLEYINKPFYFLTGKGYGGSIVDYRGTFGFYDEFAFSMDQYNNNIFIEMHSSFATIFLEYGLWGILLYIYICILGVKKNNENPWSIIGIIWFLFFVGYSFSLALFGIPALVLGLSNNKIHNTKY